MTTDRVILKSADQVMADYVPTYSPIYPLFLSKSVQYPREVGELNFKRVTALGDIRGKRITPKDTEIKQVNVTEGTKTFKKYFLANQFQQSMYQDQSNAEEVVKQVLDEHQIQMDELFLLGEGTSGSNMLNNGLYWSGDSNYTLENSTTITAGATELFLLHDAIVANASKANQVAGRKVIIFYGSDILGLFNALYPNAVKAFKVALAEVLGNQYSLVELPSACTPSASNGWIIANMDQCKLHYTDLPKLMGQGVNEENMYAWHNFGMGSSMLDVLAKDGVIRQPATYS